MSNSKPNNINLSISQIAVSVIIALIIGGITGAIATARVADTNSVLVSGHSARIEKLENSYMPRSEIEREFEHIRDSLLRIEESLNQLSKELTKYN